MKKKMSEAEVKVKVKVQERQGQGVKVVQLEADLRQKHNGTSHKLEEDCQQDGLNEQIILIQTMQIELDCL